MGGDGEDGFPASSPQPQLNGPVGTNVGRDGGIFPDLIRINDDRDAPR